MIFRLALIKRVSLVHDASLRRLAIIQPSLGYEKEYPRTLILMRRQQYIMLLARRNMTLLLGSWSVKLRSSLLYLTTRVYTPRSGSDREWERRRLSAHQGAASIPSPHLRVILAYRGVFFFLKPLITRDSVQHNTLILQLITSLVTAILGQADKS